MSDLAHRIRQAGKTPTLQVDEQNLPALGLYEKAGWKALGKLARVWLTG
jgi:predicted GNAT family acetyltransferase